MAHIPDGFLSPAVLTGTAVVSSGALTLAARASRRSLREREAPLLGAATAFLFAAQLMNFPLGAGTSAHLLGGVLIGVVVGPWAGMLVFFSVLLVQALLFADGGITALGANTLNMAVLGVGGGYLVYRWGCALLGTGPRARVSAAVLAAWCSTVLTGTAAAIELALSGTVPLKAAVTVVAGSHILVGVGEGILTGSIVAFVLRRRPDLVHTTAAPGPAARGAALSVGAAALVLGIAAARFASRRPDALEAAAARLGIRGSAPPTGTLFAGYESPLGGAWLPALLGIVVATGIGWILVRALLVRRRGT